MEKLQHLIQFIYKIKKTEMRKKILDGIALLAEIVNGKI
jgi:hypothetical protein